VAHVIQSPRSELNAEWLEFVSGESAFNGGSRSSSLAPGPMRHVFGSYGCEGAVGAPSSSNMRSSG
jgi:hypothetical protein